MRQALSKWLRRSGRRLLSASQRLSPEASREVEHRFGNFSIQLPSGHRLPEYQRTHRLYDRFLPVLVAQLEPQALVIDVGANCGDTVAAMFEANPALCFLCVEPDARFFHYLEANVARIRRSNGGRASITTRQALVGIEVKNAALEGIGGTKHAVSTGGDGMASVTLDGLLQEAGAQQPRLLKSDVDGFDYDVIQSAQGTLRRCSPLLFFECQVDTQQQKQGFERLLDSLADSGYADWVVFDNFGNLMLRTGEVRSLRQLLDYIWRQTQRQSTRTIYYVDILVGSRSDAALIDKALHAFLQ